MVVTCCVTVTAGGFDETTIGCEEFGTDGEGRLTIGTLRACTLLDGHTKDTDAISDVKAEAGSRRASDGKKLVHKVTCGGTGMTLETGVDHLTAALDLGSSGFTNPKAAAVAVATAFASAAALRALQPIDPLLLGCNKPGFAGVVLFPCTANDSRSHAAKGRP